MADLLPSTFTAVVLNAVSNALVATLLAAAAWAASRWSKPTVAHALWLLVLVKLLTPPLVGIQVPLSEVAAMFEATTPARNTATPVGQTPIAPPPAESLPQDTDAQVSLVASESASYPAPPLDDVAVDLALPYIHWDDSAGPTATPSDVDEDASTSYAAAPDLVVSPLARVDPFVDWELPAQPTHQPIEPFASDSVSASTTPPVLEPPHPNEAATTFASQLPVATRDDETSASHAIPPFVFPVLAGIWLCGALAWTALAAIRLNRFRRMMRHATPATPPLQNEVRELAARMGLRRAPDVCIVDASLTPLVWSRLGRAVLVLPRELLSRLSPEQRSAVIAHELAHLRRRDHWTRWLELAAIAAYWWLPTVWLARRKLHQAEEACCDAWVIWLLPDRRRDYARALLETLDFLHPASETPLLASGFARPSSLKRRFDMILKHRAPHRLSWFGRIAFVAAAMLVLPWTLSAVSAEGEPSPPTADAAPAEGSSNAPTATTAPELPAPPTTPAPVTPPAPNSPTTVPPTGTPGLPSDARNLTGDPPSALPPTNSAPSRPTAPLADLPPGPTSDAQPALTPVGPGVSTPAVNDAQVLQRLARLEATTAELLTIVRELRERRQSDDRVGPPRHDTGGGRGDITGGRLGANDDPVSFVLFIRREGRMVTLKTSGSQVDAVDADTGRRLWSTVAPANVTAIQSKGPDILEAIAADGTLLLIDAATGKIKQSSRIASVPNGPNREDAVQVPTATVPRRTAPTKQVMSDDAASDAPIANALRSERAAKIEIELLATERKLAIERADLQHRVRQLELRRTRLTRKLDLFTPDAVQRDPKFAEEREKVVTALEATEDELGEMQHTLDVFEAELEFKLRELQIQRDQALRGIGGASNPPAGAPAAAIRSQ